MTSLNGGLAYRTGRVRARFVEDFVLAMTETEDTELALSKAEIESGIQEQLDQSRHLLHLAESACYQLAGKQGLTPFTRQLMVSSLGTVINALKDLREMTSRWMVKYRTTLEGYDELAPLIAELADRREELIFDRSLEMPFHPELAKQAREEYRQGKFQELGEIISGVQGADSQSN